MQHLTQRIIFVGEPLTAVADRQVAGHQQMSATYTDLNTQELQGLRVFKASYKPSIARGDKVSPEGLSQIALHFGC